MMSCENTAPRGSYDGSNEGQRQSEMGQNSHKRRASSGHEGAQLQQDQPGFQPSLIQLVKDMQKTQQDDRKQVKDMQEMQLAGLELMEKLQRMQREDRQFMEKMHEANQRTQAENTRRFQDVEEAQVADHQKIQQLEQGQQDMQEKMTDVQRKIEQITNGGVQPGPIPVPRPPRAQGAAGPAPAGARAPPEAHRTNKAYTDEEYVCMVRYLIDNNKIRDAKSLDVWREARVRDRVLAGRTAEALAQRFRSHVWQNVMRGQYDVDPQILPQFRGIWPAKPF